MRVRERGREKNSILLLSLSVQIISSDTCDNRGFKKNIRSVIFPFNTVNLKESGNAKFKSPQK